MTGPPSARQQLFERLRQKKISALGAEDRILRRAPGPAVPLSFAQQRLWFIEQLEPGNPRFNILTAVRLRGRLDVPVLGRVVDEIVRRHEILRTTFDTVDGQPVQVIAPGIAVALPAVDLSGLRPGAQEDLLQALVKEEAGRPFDFVRGPLLRMLLLRFAAGHHVLILTMHQIVVDRWSRGLLVREVVALYEAFAAGAPSPLPELPVQYADFAVWQRAHLSGAVLDRLLTYWKRQLAPPLPVLDLPTDRPRPLLQGHRGRMQYYAVPQPQLAAVQALAQRQGATLFMVLLAAFAAQLHRYTDQEDIVLGSPIANRNRKETEDLIGFFLNLLALRLRPRGDATFAELLAAAREVALDAFQHQDLPFEKLVEELAVERDLGRSPLFQVTLVLQNAPFPPLRLRDLTVGLVEVDWGSTAFDLALFFWETEMWEGLPPGLSLVTSCSTDLFDAATITRLVGHFRSLLHEAAEAPERRLSELPLLSAPELQQVLREWNGDTIAGPPGPPGVALPQLFSLQAARSPHAVALDFPDGRVTYGDLDRFAGELARRLAELGIGAGSAVGVLAAPGWRTVAGFLGVLKAGAAYLPIRPEEPAERLGFLLTDAGASILLVPAGEEAAGLPPAVRRLSLADCLAAAPAPGAPLPGPCGGAPACILYTSGSTGAPKGVWVPHRALVRMAAGGGYLALAPRHRVAQAMDLTFDAASFEIWGSLLAGAALVGVERSVILSPPSLAAAIRERGITTLFLTTALFHVLAGEEPAIFSGLEHLLIGGETPAEEPVRKVLRHGPPGRFLHLYGPTESTTFSLWHEIGEESFAAGRLPLGRPIGGTQVYLCGAAMNPVPAGAQGEIFLGGDGLTLGYLRRPGLTAAAFVPDPFSEIPGGRLLRTGDRARRLPGGALLFCGRSDRQVKVRGFRVEPGEVEAALAAHPAVREAVVVPWEARPGELDLAAWMVLAPSEHPGDEEIRSHLRRRLPAYMVPSTFARLERLPLDAHGKVDRASLPHPAAAREERPAPAPPRTPAERLLTGIWAEVLGREVGIDDDFFALGGHSLDATRVVSRLRARHGIELPVRRLFEQRTVAGLAGDLTASPAAGGRLS